MLGIEDKIKAFLDDFIDVIFDLLEESIDKGIELGFMLCQTNNKIIPGSICTGEKCHVKVTDCSVGKPVGVLHTHPGSHAEPSVGDIVYSIDNKYPILCISGKFPKETCCYKVNEKHPEMLQMLDRINNILKEEENLEKRCENIDKLSESERRELLKEIREFNRKKRKIIYMSESLPPKDSYELIGCRRIKKFVKYE